MTLSPKQREIKARVIKEIALLPKTDDMTQYACMVLAIFDKVPSIVWRSVDDDIGNAAPPFRGDHRGYLVRRVRNHPVWGPRLFEVLGR